jgi:predicted SAM-dependent methyltransferase
MRKRLKAYGLRFLQSIAARNGYDIVKRVQSQYRSETSKCRERLAKFCVGYGVDLGPGGDPINETAIRVDLPQSYSQVGLCGVQLGGDARRLNWFRDGVLDYVYSSHLLEDFENTEDVLKEWLRVLKPGGRLVLFCPDEQAYRNHCALTQQPYNTYHKHSDFRLASAKEALSILEYKTRILHETPLVDDYSWELVVEKLPSGRNEDLHISAVHGGAHQKAGAIVAVSDLPHA